MKKTTTLFVALAFIFSAHAQIATFTLSEFIPESGSVTEIYAKNPNFNNSFIFIMNHGLTVFNQTREIFLVDSKSLTEKKKIDYPKYKGYDKLEAMPNEDVNGNLLLFLINKPAKMNALSVVKINESLTVPEKPEYLFSLDQYLALTFAKNDKKDICVLAYPEDNKKEKKSYYHFHVYDNNMKLIKADSIEYVYKAYTNSLALPYDNGCAVIKGESKITVTLNDIKNNKTSTVNLANGSSTLTVSKIKTIGDKIYIAGKYSLKEKKMKNGLFKAVYNQKTNALEEQVYFDHVAVGKGEKEDIDKNVENCIITETGACYYVISQGPINSFSEYNFNNKFELVYINSATDKWKKQLPFAGKSVVHMLHKGGFLYISYLDYEGNSVIDVNRYTYGEPTPSVPVTLRQEYQTNISVLKVAANGTITQQGFKDNHYNRVFENGNEFIGIHQGLNGQVTSKCRYFKLTDLK